MSQVWLVIGLGNPGAKYAGNRHNVGAMVVDTLAGRMAGSLTAHKAGAAVLDGRLGVLPGGVPGPRVIVAKPSTYMNTSGRPVAGLCQFYGVESENLIVVHDELDIPEHALRLKRGGGEGGHNGLKSITSTTGTKNYIRLRFGIGRPPGRQDPADYVLRPFSSAERADLPTLLERGADAIEDVIGNGLEKATMRLHSH